MKILLILVCLIITAACTTLEKTARIKTSLRTQEYNSVASRYMERPTFVAIESMSSGQNVLMIQMDTYGLPQAYAGLKLVPKEADALRNSQIRFLKEQVPNYLSMINRFQEWAELATKRGDAFTKEIGRAPTWANLISGELVFSFHSGNDKKHFLNIAFHAAGKTLDDTSQYFDVRNTIELKRLLTEFGIGSIQITDIDQVYR